MGDTNSNYIPPIIDDDGGVAPTSVVALAVVAVGVYAVLATVAAGVVVLEGAIGARGTSNIIVKSSGGAYICGATGIHVITSINIL